jgi:hypothetical protein
MECINKCVAGRTHKQYRIDNTDKLKQYRIDNTDKIKQYRIDNIDKNKQYRIDNADKIKQYRIDNADKSKQYRIDNADKIKQKFHCKCGGKYNYNSKSTHIKSNKHQKYLNKPID